MKIKVSKIDFIFYIVIAALLFCAILFAILNEYAFGAKTSSFLLFLTIISLGLGIVFLLQAFAKKKRMPIFLSAIAFIVGNTILLISVFHLIWWIIVACDLFICIFFAFLSLSLNGDVTESISLNKDAEYKSYKERLAELELEKQNRKQEKMPELKSYSKEDK